MEVVAITAELKEVTKASMIAVKKCLTQVYSKEQPEARLKLRITPSEEVH